jgi:3-hydroxyacyl-CoA dehydrogenase
LRLAQMGWRGAGGPMFWADTVGLSRIVEGLRDLEARFGAAFAPAKLLVDIAAQGARFTRSVSR